MNGLVIDVLDHADLDGLLTLWRRSGQPAEDVAAILRAGSAAVLVGRLRGHVRASVVVGHDGRRGRIHHVAVDPGYARRGYGRTMVLAAEDWLRGQEIRLVELSITAGNVAAVQFCEALGYEEPPWVHLEKSLDDRRRSRA